MCGACCASNGSERYLSDDEECPERVAMSIRRSWISISAFLAARIQERDKFDWRPAGAVDAEAHHLADAKPLSANGGILPRPRGYIQSR
jgi:hypothetical protein